MAGWGNGGGQLPVGNHVAQVRDVEKVTGKDFKDKTKIVQQFKWGVDYWDGQKWMSHTVYTGQNFADLSKIDNPQFIPKLCLLVRACGLPLPQSASEAAAWHEDALIGKRFVISVQPDEMLGTVQTRYLPYREKPAAAAPVETAAPAPVPAAPAAAPVAPASVYVAANAPDTSGDQRAAAAPPPPPSMAGAGVGAGVTAPSDPWS